MSYILLMSSSSLPLESSRPNGSHRHRHVPTSAKPFTSRQRVQCHQESEIATHIIERRVTRVKLAGFNVSVSQAT